MSPQIRLPVGTGRLALALLEWYTDHKRDLPWRQTDDPYHVWLSETMLQQTQVKVVVPYFKRFVAAFPTIEELDQADVEQVLALWSGLGYYSRARSLHSAAVHICTHHQGVFPRDLEPALSLKGVGRYTAGAVLSIAYGQPEPIVDGNIRRVLARFLGMREPLGPNPQQLWSLMQRVVRHPAVRPSVSRFNQALMELGALVCTPARPGCQTCPIAFGCRARKMGAQEEIPLPRKRRRVETVRFLAGVIQRNGCLLLNKNPNGPLVRGLWDLPLVEDGAEAPVPGVEETFWRRHGLKVEIAGELSCVRHQITYRKLFFRPILLHLEQDAPGQAHWKWVRMDKAAVPVASYVRKIWNLSVARPRDSGL